MRERTGSITRTASGRYQVRLRLPDGTRKTLGVYDSEEDADVERRAALDLLYREAPDGENTLQAYGNAWLDGREKVFAVKDPKSDRSRWNNHVATDEIAKMSMRAIKAHHIEDFVARLKAKKSTSTGERLSTSSIKNTMNLVRLALAHAKKRGLIKENPTSDVKITPQGSTTDVWRYLRPDAQQRLIDETPLPLRYIVVFAMTTGLRAGELVSLRLVDVHEDEVIVRFSGSDNTSTKGKSVRTVPLTPIAKDALTQWIAQLHTYTASKRHPNGRNPRGLVFPGAHGGSRSENHVVRWASWKAILERAKVSIRWHDLRHTCGTALACGWWGRQWTLQEIQKFLGHQQISTTERYAKIASEELLRASAATQSNGLRLGYAKVRIAPEPTNSAPPARIELATFGLGTQPNDGEMTTETGDRSPSVAIALDFMFAAAQGHHDRAWELADLIAPGRTIAEVAEISDRVLREAVDQIPSTMKRTS